jgi:hypothetical protein
MKRARYALAHLGIAGVGVGSFVFHATLDWYAQASLKKYAMGTFNAYVSSNPLGAAR